MMNMSDLYLERLLPLWIIVALVAGCTPATPPLTPTLLPTPTLIITPTPTQTPTLTPTANPLEFDGEAAFAHVVAQTEFGFRPTGSEAGWATGDYIISYLEEQG